MPIFMKSFRSTFFASRYDYLRIARAMLIDWQNDTCVGKYLKNILKQKANRQTRKKSPFSSAAGYAGFFHTDFKYGFGKVSGNVFVDALHPECEMNSSDLIWLNFRLAPGCFRWA